MTTGRIERKLIIPKERREEKRGERLPACEQTVINLTFSPSHTHSPSCTVSLVRCECQSISNFSPHLSRTALIEGNPNMLFTDSYLMSPSSWACTHTGTPEHLYVHTHTTTERRILKHYASRHKKVDHQLTALGRSLPCATGSCVSQYNNKRIL